MVRLEDQPSEHRVEDRREPPVILINVVAEVFDYLYPDLARVVFVGEHASGVEVRVGVVLFPEPPPHAEELIDRLPHVLHVWRAERLEYPVPPHGHRGLRAPHRFLRPRAPEPETLVIRVYAEGVVRKRSEEH